MKRTELNVNFTQQWKARGQDLVARGTLIRQGVFCGSRGCILHPGESIKNSVQSWNRVPVTFGHPKIGDDFVAAEDVPDSIIGHLEGPTFRNGALIADIVISEQDKDIRRELQSSREVSIGLFSDEISSHGVYEDKEYSYISQNYRPDHLAILRPGEVGACSWEADGCGINANQELLKEAVRIYANNILGKGENDMEVEPLLPPGIRSEKEKEEKKEKAEQEKGWTGPGIEPLLPSHMNKN